MGVALACTNACTNACTHACTLHAMCMRAQAWVLQCSSCTYPSAPVLLGTQALQMHVPVHGAVCIQARCIRTAALTCYALPPTPQRTRVCTQHARTSSTQHVDGPPPLCFSILPHPVRTQPAHAWQHPSKRSKAQVMILFVVASSWRAALALTPTPWRQDRACLPRAVHQCPHMRPHSYALPPFPPRRAMPAHPCLGAVMCLWRGSGGQHPQPGRGTRMYKHTPWGGGGGAVGVHTRAGWGEGVRWRRDDANLI